MADILEAIKPQQQLPPPPQPFEIALIRKIESKTSSVRNAFLLLDIDGDGRITPSDVRTVLHNELGLDLTTTQEECLFARIHQFHKQKKESESGTNNNGMGYVEFAKYFQQVSSATLPSSQSGSAAAMGFHRQNTEDVATTTTDADGSSKPLRTSGEMPIHLSATTIIHKKRHQLRQLLSSHSSREGAGSSGMKETSLFLKMNVHRSAKVTMSELLHWINEVGMFDWTMDDLKEVVLNRAETKKGGKSGKDDEQLLELKWFGSGNNSDGEKGEAGMTERDFAEFVESLDGE